MSFQSNQVFKFSLTIFLWTGFSSNTLGQTDFFTFVEVLEDGVQGSDGLRGVKASAVSPDGKHLYAVAAGDFSIALYNRNLEDGNLSFEEIWRDQAGGVEGLEDPRHLVISPDGKHVYVGSYSGKAISAFERDNSTGHLSFIQKVDLGAMGYGPVSNLAITPDGKDVFSISDNAISFDSGMSQLKRNSSSGELEWIQWYEEVWGLGDEIGQRADFVITGSENNFVYVAAHGRNNASLTAFLRNSPNQRLTPVDHELHREQAADGLTRPEVIAQSPDGKFLYTANFAYGIGAFESNKSLEKIEFTDYVGLDFPIWVAVTGSGSHLLSFNNWALVSFERDLETGKLLQIDRVDYDDDFETAEYRTLLISANHLEISPNGDFVYISNDQYHLLGSFKIDSAPTFPPPQTPSNVNATNGSYLDKVRVTWNSVPGADEVQVFRCTTMNTEDCIQISTVDISTTTYDDHDADENGTVHFYRLKACSSVNGCSDFSVEDAGYRLPPNAKVFSNGFEGNQ